MWYFRKRVTQISLRWEVKQSVFLTNCFLLKKNKNYEYSVCYFYFTNRKRSGTSTVTAGSVCGRTGPPPGSTPPGNGTLQPWVKMLTTIKVLKIQSKKIISIFDWNQRLESIDVSIWYYLLLNQRLESTSRNMWSFLMFCTKIKG